MGNDKRLEYLRSQNKELVKELTHQDYVLNRTKSHLVKQQKGFKLLIELQKAIAFSNDNKDFYESVALLTISEFDMAATYIYEPSISENEYTLLAYNDIGSIEREQGPKKQLESISLPEFSESQEYILINNDSEQNELNSSLKEIFELTSLIIYPVKYDNNIELVIVTGMKNIDTVWFLDLTIEDVRIIEAVAILISSYLRRIEITRLNERDKYKTEFISNISHEFRTPLTLVTGLLDQLRARLSPSLNSEELEKFEIISNNAIRIKELIDQLLDISKIETGTNSLSVKKSNLGELLTRISKSFFPIAKESGIDFRFSYSDSSKETWFDEDKLEKIISNLLSNAFKFTPGKGKIELTLIVEYDGNRSEASISVSDTGIGIPASEKDKIFDRFYQYKPEKNPGTGIGLYLVKTLTEMHHGTINLNSKINKGSVFTVRIPIDYDSYSDEERASADIAEGSSKKEPYNNIGSLKSQEQDLPTILVVEDNEDLNNFITSGLQNDFDIIKAYNGKEGFQYADSEIPDLIITDVMMPFMDGYEMTVKLKDNAKTRHIPIIMLTAKADRESTLLGLESGADDYISKPFNMDELIIKTGNIIRTRKQLKEKYKADFLTSPDESEIPSSNDSLLKDVIELMKENLSEPDFQVNNICKELYISRTQLYRKIEALTGYSPGELMRLIRLKTAAVMFRKDHHNVAQVMYRVGFSNQSNFAKIFKAQSGINPSAYIQKYST